MSRAPSVLEVWLGCVRCAPAAAKRSRWAGEDLSGLTALAASLWIGVYCRPWARMAPPSGPLRYFSNSQAAPGLRADFGTANTTTLDSVRCLTRAGGGATSQVKFLIVSR